MNAQGAGATDVSEETTTEVSPSQEAVAAEERAGAEQAPVTTHGSVLGDILREQGLSLDDVKVKPETPAAPAAEEQPDPEIPAEPTTPEPETPRPAAEKPVPEEWPDSAKARVAEEAGKRRTWKGKAEAAEKQVQTLTEELQAARSQAQPSQTPTPQDPLVNVTNPKQLEGAVAYYEALRDFAEDNPDGAVNVEVGKDADGQPILKDYSREDILEIKREARFALDKAVPAKVAWMRQAAAESATAQEAYPNIFTEGTPENEEANRMLASFPEIKRLPNFAVLIGDAIAGKAAREARKGKAGPNGKPLSESASKVLGAPRVTPAPATTKTRSVETSSAAPEVVDRKQVREQFIEAGGGTEALETMVSRLRSGQGASPRGRVEKVLA